MLISLTHTIDLAVTPVTEPPKLGHQRVSNVTLMLSGPSFAASHENTNTSNAINPWPIWRNGRLQWTVFTGLNVTVSDISEENLPTGMVMCGRRDIILDWRAPIALGVGVSSLSDSVDALTASTVTSGTTSNIIMQRAGSVSHRILRDAQREFSAPSTHPHVSLKDTSGRAVSCASDVPACMMNISQIVELPAVAAATGRRLLSANFADSGLSILKDDTKRDLRITPSTDMSQSAVDNLRLKFQVIQGHLSLASLSMHFVQNRETISVPSSVCRLMMVLFINGTIPPHGAVPPSPNNTDVVYIPPGTTLEVDVALADVKFWIIDGSLIVPSDVTTNVIIAAESIVLNGGTLRVGTEDKPLSANRSVTFELRGNPTGSHLPGVGARAIVAFDAEVSLFG